MFTHDSVEPTLTLFLLRLDDKFRIWKQWWAWKHILILILRFWRMYLTGYLTWSYQRLEEAIPQCNYIALENEDLAGYGYEG